MVHSDKNRKTVFDFKEARDNKEGNTPLSFCALRVFCFCVCFALLFLVVRSETLEEPSDVVLVPLPFALR